MLAAAHPADLHAARNVTPAFNSQRQPKRTLNLPSQPHLNLGHGLRQPQHKAAAAGGAKRVQRQLAQLCLCNHLLQDGGHALQGQWERLSTSVDCLHNQQSKASIALPLPQYTFHLHQQPTFRSSDLSAPVLCQHMVSRLYDDTATTA